MKILGQLYCLLNHLKKKQLIFILSFFISKYEVYRINIKDVCVCVCVCVCVRARALCSVMSLCDPMDYSPPGSSVHGVLQARIVGWFAISSSRGSSRSRDRTHSSCISCIAGEFFTTELPGKLNIKDTLCSKAVVLMILAPQKTT